MFWDEFDFESDAFVADGGKEIVKNKVIGVTRGDGKLKVT